MTDNLPVQPGQQLEVINFEDYAMTPANVIKQVNVIQEVMRSVMKVDEHYGIIPGTQKPSLYKAGAEKLSLTFRLRPEYTITKTELAGGHREYEALCTLIHIPTGQIVGQCAGSATTMEGKYRYRGGEKLPTGQAVPKEYWNLKKAGKLDEAQTLIGGPGFSAGKIAGAWQICTLGEKQEHDNPADYYNTVLKMAQKRAYVSTVLGATAASDIFTVDVEDMVEVIPGAKAQAEKQATEKPTIKEPQSKSDPQAMQTASFVITKLDSKTGEKNGKKWHQFYIADNETVYNTFDTKLAAKAKTAFDSAAPILIGFTSDQYGNKIQTLEIQIPEQSQGPDESDNDPSNR